MASTRRPLSALPSDLTAAGYRAPTYRLCYLAALDARIPAARGENGRWTYHIDTLPMIADALGCARVSDAA